ncbi:hypothetical protein C8R48DRAFT_716346 [Suillus tomentosus]|nr:hypothetical protein C8R48DRAFT_716346 [Suillus tomentosus]
MISDSTSILTGTRRGKIPSLEVICANRFCAECALVLSGSDSRQSAFQIWTRCYRCATSSWCPR